MVPKIVGKWMVIPPNMVTIGFDPSPFGGFLTQMRTMVLEYEHQHLPQKLPSFVGKYTSTMEHMGNLWGYPVLNGWFIRENHRTSENKMDDLGVPPWIGNLLLDFFENDSHDYKP